MYYRYDRCSNSGRRMLFLIFFFYYLIVPLCGRHIALIRYIRTRSKGCGETVSEKKYRGMDELPFLLKIKYDRIALGLNKSNCRTVRLELHSFKRGVSKKVFENRKQLPLQHNFTTKIYILYFRK